MHHYPKKLLWCAAGKTKYCSMHALFKEATTVKSIEVDLETV
jgi:hypothetical protein